MIECEYLTNRYTSIPLLYDHNPQVKENCELQYLFGSLFIYKILCWFDICLQSAWKVLGDVDFLHHAMPPVNDDAGPRGCRQTPQDFVNEAQDAKYKSFKRVQASRRSYAHALHLDPSEGIFWGDMAASCYQESRLQKTYRGGKPSMVG